MALALFSTTNVVFSSLLIASNLMRGSNHQEKIRDISTMKGTIAGAAPKTVLFWVKASRGAGGG